MDLEKCRGKSPHSEKGGMAEGELTGVTSQDIPGHTQISEEEDHDDKMNEVATEELREDKKEGSHHHYHENISNPLVVATHLASQKDPVA
jgi:hypothetical protein